MNIYWNLNFPFKANIFMFPEAIISMEIFNTKKFKLNLYEININFVRKLLTKNLYYFYVIKQAIIFEM